MTTHSYSLLVLLLLPLVGAAATMAVPRSRGTLAKQVGFLFALATVVDVIVLGARFQAGGPRFQYATSWTWISGFGAHIAFGVDGIDQSTWRYLRGALSG